MNFEKACENLDLLNINEITYDILKKQYRLMALTYHPDKNNSVDASNKFQNINESYQYLLKYLEYGDIFDDDNDEDIDDDEEPYFQDENNKAGYRWALYSFIKNIMKNDIQNTLFYKIIQKLSNVCEDKAIHMLEKIDKNKLIKIYEIIKKYRQAFHFNPEFFDKIEILLANKIENDECIILNPSLDDLIENNLYKLKLNGFEYIVPLWHDELQYDNSGRDIYIKCNPNLPENITIDENNNLHIDLSYTIFEIWGKDEIDFIIGKQTISFKVNNLRLVKKQRIIIPNKGISKINTKNIYDISKKSDLILNITLI